MACLRLGELPQAEEALGEANVLNNRHPVVWGQLALLCLQLQRFDEAQQALGQAYKLELADAGLLLQLGVAFYEVGKWSDAEAAVRRSLLRGESGPAQKALGDVLMEQHRYEESLEAFRSALAQGDLADEAAKHCKKQASHLLHFHLGRPAEAESL